MSTNEYRKEINLTSELNYQLYLEDIQYYYYYRQLLHNYYVILA